MAKKPISKPKSKPKPKPDPFDKLFDRIAARYSKLPEDRNFLPHVVQIMLSIMIVKELKAIRKLWDTKAGPN